MRLGNAHSASSARVRCDQLTERFWGCGRGTHEGPLFFGLPKVEEPDGMYAVGQIKWRQPTTGDGVIFGLIR